MIEQMIENATALSRSLTHAANDFVAALSAMRDEAVAIEAELNNQKARASAEIGRLREEIEQKRQEHHQLERSLASLRATLGSLFAEGDAARARVG